MLARTVDRASILIRARLRREIRMNSRCRPFGAMRGGQDGDFLERSVVGDEAGAKETGHDDALDRVAWRIVSTVCAVTAGDDACAAANFGDRQRHRVRDCEKAAHAARAGQAGQLAGIERLRDGSRVTIERAVHRDLFPLRSNGQRDIDRQRESKTHMGLTFETLEARRHEREHVITGRQRGKSIFSVRPGRHRSWRHQRETGDRDANSRHPQARGISDNPDDRACPDPRELKR